MDTRSEKTGGPDRSRGDMAAKPQTHPQHSGEWQQDLNPDHMAGQNLGPTSGEREQGLPTAYDIREIHRSLAGFADDELKKIPVLPEGARLQQGATYLDLNDPEREEFTATGGMEAAGDHRIVPKAEVPHSLWNRLRGIDDPERTLRAPERGQDR
jgi:hypothetical protein